mgnify:CR=1 FL=1
MKHPLLRFLIRTRTRRRNRKYSKIAVTALLVSVGVFVIAMTAVFCIYGAVPDSLIAGVFSFAGGEAGFLCLIKHSDTKYSSISTGSSDYDDAAG